MRAPRHRVINIKRRGGQNNIKQRHQYQIMAPWRRNMSDGSVIISEKT